MLKSGKTQCDGHIQKELLPGQELISPLSNSPNLLNLNDDCLLEIMQYLTISDTFSLLGYFSSRIDDIACKRISQLKCLNCNLRDPPKFSSTQLQVIGQHLKTLNFSVGYSLDSERCISQYLQPLCQHGSIQNLTLNYVQFRDGYQQCILNLAPNLKYLDLSFCQLTDELLRPILENCLQLKTLSILGNYDWKGTSLRYIKSQNVQSITVELNDHCSDEVKGFVEENDQICINVYWKGRNVCHTYH